MTMTLPDAASLCGALAGLSTLVAGELLLGCFKRRGGIWWFKCGRFGGSFYLSRRRR